MAESPRVRSQNVTAFVVEAGATEVDICTRLQSSTLTYTNEMAESRGVCEEWDNPVPVGKDIKLSFDKFSNYNIDTGVEAVVRGIEVTVFTLTGAGAMPLIGELESGSITMNNAVSDGAGISAEWSEDNFNTSGLTVSGSFFVSDDAGVTTPATDVLADAISSSLAWHATANKITGHTYSLAITIGRNVLAWSADKLVVQDVTETKQAGGMTKVDITLVTRGAPNTTIANFVTGSKADAVLAHVLEGDSTLNVRWTTDAANDFTWGVTAGADFLTNYFIVTSLGIEFARRQIVTEKYSASMYGVPN